MDWAGDAMKRRRRFFAARLGIEEAQEGHTFALQTEDGFVNGVPEVAIDEVSMAQRSQQRSGPSNVSIVGFPCDNNTNQHVATLETLTWNATFLAEVSTPSKSASAECTGSIQHCRVDSGMNDEALKWFSGKDINECFTWDCGDSVAQVNGARKESLQWSNTVDRASNAPLTEVGFPCAGPQEKDSPLGICISQGHQLEGLESIAIGDPFWRTVLGDLELGTFSVKDTGKQGPIPHASLGTVTSAPPVCQLEQPSPGNNLDRPNKALRAQGLQTLGQQEGSLMLEAQPPNLIGEDSKRQTSEPFAPAPPPSSSGGAAPCGAPVSNQGVDSPVLHMTHNSRSSSTEEHRIHGAGDQPPQAAASASNNALQLQKQRSEVWYGKDRCGTREAPDTSWILLGRHMWEQGVIPDIVSLTLLDDPSQEHPPAATLRLAERNSNDKKGDGALVTCPAGKGLSSLTALDDPPQEYPAAAPWRLAESSSKEGKGEGVLTTHPAGNRMFPASPLSTRLAATIASLKDRERKRKLVGEGIPNTATPGNTLLMRSPKCQSPGGGGSIKVVPGIQSPGIQGPVPGREERAGSGSMAGTSILGVPRFQGKGGLKNMVMGRLIQAAAALGSGNKAQFLSQCALVRPHANRRGTASQRVAHMLLNMLTLRAEGKGVDFLKKSNKCSVKDSEKCLLWHYSTTPMALFAFTSIVCEIMPKLVGKSRVHIVNFGDQFMPFLPILIRLLVNHSSRDNHTRLQTLRVTTVSYFKVLWRYGKNTTAVRHPAKATPVLSAVAAECGLELEHQWIEVEDNNMQLLQTVQRRKGDPLAVMFAESLKYAPDSVGLGALTETMKCVVALQPDVIAITEADVDGSQQEFLPRFINTAFFFWEHLHMHDVVASERCKPVVHMFEQMIWFPIACNVLACEGAERRVCPRSSQGWQEHFESWGFKQRAVSSSTLYGASKVVDAFSGGFSVGRTGKHLSLTWNGVPLCFTASFAQKKQQTSY